MSHARIEEVSDSDPASDPDEVDLDDFDDTDIMRRVEPASARPPPAASSSSAAAFAQQQAVPAGPPGAGTISATDAERAQYNSFQCLYPVYFDATRSRAQGRRVPASLAVANPLAREIATACSRLRLPTLLEPDKVHPKDWANPGRVKVGLKKASPQGVSNKHHLYLLVAQHLRDNPTTDDSLGLRVRLGGQLQPDQGKPYPRPAVPRGWKMGELLPYLSPAMTGGGVSEDLFKDMMREMQGGGNPMAALAGGMGMGGPSGADESPAGGSSAKKDKKNKKKGKA
jgi:signal recognition particle subunit SRP19